LVRIAMIDSFKFKGWYTWHLVRELGKIAKKNHSKLFLYAPRKLQSEEKGYFKIRKIWSPLLFPFQIFKQTIKDKINIIHVQFEYNTFGPLYTSVLVVFLLLLVKMRKIKVIVTLHGPIFSISASSKLFEILRPTTMRFPLIFLKNFAIVVYKLVGCLADTILVHAKIFKKWLATLKIKSTVIPHGTVIEKEKNTVIKKKSKRILLYFGVLSPRKGIECLLKAFSIVKRILAEQYVMLIIAGREPSYYRGYLSHLRKIANELKILKDVLFTGFVKEEQIKYLFKIADLVILPYLVSVSASGPLMLAISYGKPVIASSTEYFKEVLSDIKESVLFPPCDAKTLSDVILKLLCDDSLRRTLEKKMRRKAFKYEWGKIARKTYALYLSLVKK